MARTFPQLQPLAQPGGDKDLLMDGFFYSQALVEDIAANKQLAILNAAMREVEATNASTKLGVLPPLAFLIVAILFIFTLSFVIGEFLQK